MTSLFRYFRNVDFKYGFTRRALDICFTVQFLILLFRWRLQVQGL
ncbi:hypothetical protein D1BOALGB6SA_1817 [Olavius sp. associated proteobacterium Delta 1]|nr:hypothetical protein D1BOALGB6SA_1817 [Olavius sp. associated proteobacterium Delta 1]